MTRASPASMPLVAKVTMKAGSLKRVMKRPLKKPARAPTNRVTGTKSMTGILVKEMKLTATIAVRAMMPPMDISIPAVIMTRVNPIATIPICAAS